MAWGRVPLRLLCDSTSLLRALLPTSFSGIGPAASVPLRPIRWWLCDAARTGELVVPQVDGQH